MYIYTYTEYICIQSHDTLSKNMTLTWLCNENICIYIYYYIYTYTCVVTLTWLWRDFGMNICIYIYDYIYTYTEYTCIQSHDAQDANEWHAWLSKNMTLTWLCNEYIYIHILLYIYIYMRRDSDMTLTWCCNEYMYLENQIHGTNLC